MVTAQMGDGKEAKDNQLGTNASKAVNRFYD